MSFKGFLDYLNDQNLFTHKHKPEISLNRFNLAFEKDIILKAVNQLFPLQNAE